jgi:hypothetical protein
MPIHEKKRMPKSDHYILKYGDWKFGQGNASAHILHQPPIRISSPQGKIEVHKHVCADATCIYADEIFIFKYFFPRPCGRDQCPHIRDFFFFFFFFASVPAGPTSTRTCLGLHRRSFTTRGCGKSPSAGKTTSGR